MEQFYLEDRFMTARKIFFSLIIIAGLLSYTGCKPKAIESSEEGASAEKLLMLNGREYLAAVITTSKGDVELELFAAQTPRTVENFVKLALKGYYKGNSFHRIMKNFMIQCGDPTETGEGGESIFGKVFDDEIVPNIHFDDPGMVAMANKGPDTNGSQFFITTIPTPWLDRQHTIFGKVITGMEVVLAISNVKVDESGKPAKKIKIEKIVIEKRAR